MFKRFGEAHIETKVFIITVIVMFAALIALSIHPYIRAYTHRTEVNNHDANP